MKAVVLMATTTVLLMGCGNNEAARADSATAANSSAPAAAQQPTIALGLTREQLEDADILDTTGREIAEVEQVVMDSSGKVTGLLVEIDDTDPDRNVTIPLDGLVVVVQGHDRNLRGPLTRDQLLAKPEAGR
ncbi:PRC-barrel domain-containing protein [Sphingomonas aliaeris]|uniref:PRC-barrel domain-containing protein n=1 Tax=Sphingomonas aliaeris TaxID=2759526 RepID=A0A974S515_9SPHN|nr:PRC-barrel domain-containing protein [Sphingomonas aliaeris]QQV77981.1 PRC-barrel domain-containing protein [Sphingomonas aliaeris]